MKGHNPDAKTKFIEKKLDGSDSDSEYDDRFADNFRKNRIQSFSGDEGIIGNRGWVDTQDP